jgi:acyl-CoA thioesterase-1
VSRILALIFLAVLTASSWAAEPKTLLVFGDSLSAGYGLRREEAWPVLLQEKLGADWLVINASVSGETTAGGLTRLPAALAQHKPTIVVIELGANDGLRGLPVDVARKNLASMIELDRASGAKTLLIGMKLPPNFGSAFGAKFSGMYDDLAQAYKLPPPPFLLDGIADKPELFQADQLHPIASAEAQLRDNVMAGLNNLIKAPSKKTR